LSWHSFTPSTPRTPDKIYGAMVVVDAARVLSVTPPSGGFSHFLDT